MKKLTKILIVDILCILSYVVYIVWCVVYGSDRLSVWYEYLLIVVGILAINHAVLLRSTLVMIVGIVTLCIGICTVL